MKKIIAALAVTILSSLAAAHSGGTDSNGCHKDHQTGTWHCH